MSFTGIAVSGLILRWKARELCSDPEFKASLGWYQNWKKRHAMSFRTKTTLAQRLPQNVEEKTIQFHRFVIAAWQRHGYLLSRIFNLDETPMRFEQNPWIQWQQNHSREVLWCQEEELYGDTRSHHWWQQITTCSDLQRCTHSTRPRCSRLWSCIVPQEGLDGWER